VIFICIRWGDLFGGFHKWTHFLSVTMFHVIQGFFLMACLWTAFDSRFSPRHLQPGLPCLPLYYLGALSIGHFSGYFLLVFGVNTENQRRRSRSSAPSIRPAMTALIWLLAAGAPAFLIYKNLPNILRQKNSALARCFDTMQKSLPPKGAIVLSEDPTRLEYLETSLIRNRSQSRYLLMDTSLLPHDPAYFQFLDRTHPDFKLAQTTTNGFADMTNSVLLVLWLKNLSETHDVYLMHPYAGLLAELFYTQQHGLFYQLQLYPTNSSHAPPLPEAVVAENRTFWRAVEAEQFPVLLPHIETAERPAGHGSTERLRRVLSLPSELDEAALLAGGYYSLMLNAWGVELQRLGLLADASKCFGQARQLNPQNSAAEINQGCNLDLQSHKLLGVDLSHPVEDRLAQHRNWDQILREDGPSDEPNACYRLGTLFTDARMFRQAVQQFERVEALAPGDTNTPLRLGDLYMKLGEFTNSLAAAGRMLELAPEHSRALVMQGWSLIYLRKFYQAIPPLNEAINRQPDNPDARLARAMAYLNVNKLLAAREDYKRAVQITPDAYPAYFGLAQIAYLRKETAGTITNCELYLARAPSDTPEAGQIKALLKTAKQLKMQN
ncbi:MAG: prsT, partial [Pedosphaera sp.]|nr:prsT [Pedosphaera sp.]